ncbi:hypothetical protein MOQ_002380 [Trypanosoma cruzi marinkellei]|uniref:Uncharacterized protein n=1 Tax=Trypanosoma cruzi marinkellei TaxID=85056 RepID=K2MFZ2_TRYCR|nr:hypothetical protein MOQ_002380 [Trypanosoma cruzi marinkellei]
MAGRTITSMCTVEEESPAPLFVGREDGSIELYGSTDAACFGRPSLTLYGHTKAITAMFAPSLDEVFSCSMDGTLRHWSTEKEPEEMKHCLKVSKVGTPLRCLMMHEGVLYTGGDDGCLYAIEGSRRSSWPGHKDVLSCITVVAEDSQYIITGSYDNQIRVWDTKSAKTIRLLVGHQNHIKCLRVIGAGELLLSFGRDLTMKIWRLPEFGDEEEEDVAPPSPDTIRHATVSFREPTDATSMSDRPVVAATDGGEESGEVPVKASTNTEVPLGSADESVNKHYHAAVQGAAAVKSAIKTRPQLPIRQLRCVGTIEIPEAPHVVAATSNEASYCHIGTSDGYVLGVNVRALSRSVLNFLAHNAAEVRADTRGTRLTLRVSIRAIKKRCRNAIQKKQLELLRAAKRARAKKRAEERKERAAARAAEREARAAKRAEEKDDDDEEEEEEEEEEQDIEEEEEEENDGDEEQEEEEEDPLALLDDAQREEFEAFRKQQEKERDEEIESLRKAAEERNKVVGKIGSVTYDTTRDRFFFLSFTSYKKIGSDAVLGLVALPGGKCCAAQSDRIKSADTTPGITYL